jgi:arylsulfatase A-like enzyme
MIHHAYDGMFAIRKGDWKLIEGLGSGGFTEPLRVEATGRAVPYQLYNFVDDPGEEHDVASEYPEIVSELLADLNRIRGSGWGK